MLASVTASRGSARGAPDAELRQRTSSAPTRSSARARTDGFAEATERRRASTRGARYGDDARFSSSGRGYDRVDGENEEDDEEAPVAGRGREDSRAPRRHAGRSARWTTRHAAPEEKEGRNACEARRVSVATDAGSGHRSRSPESASVPDPAFGSAALGILGAERRERPCEPGAGSRSRRRRRSRRRPTSRSFGSALQRLVVARRPRLAHLVGRRCRRPSARPAGEDPRQHEALHRSASTSSSSGSIPLRSHGRDAS